MKYDALTFDTQTVHKSAFNFFSGLLARLAQFKDGPTRIVLAEIVVREILKHLSNKTREAQDGLQNACRKAIQFGVPGAAEWTSVDTRAASQTRMRQFIDKIGAVIAPASVVRTDALVELYFQQKPPFSSAKKAEFPDAIALVSLELWAVRHKKRILAVSGDPDWKAFAETSPHIDVVEDLAIALQQLQQDANDALKLLETLFDQIRLGSGRAGDDAFYGLIDEALADMSVSGEAQGEQVLTSDHVELSLKSYRVPEEPTELDLVLIEAGPGALVCRIDLILSVEASTSFRVSRKDPIDRDQTALGYVTANDEVLLATEALVTFTPLLGGGWAASDVEIVDFPDPVMLQAPALYFEGRIAAEQEGVFD